MSHYDRTRFLFWFAFYVETYYSPYTDYGYRCYSCDMCSTATAQDSTSADIFNRKNGPEIIYGKKSRMDKIDTKQ